MEYDDEDDDRVRSICDGLRRGLSRVGAEPLPDRLQELLETLRRSEQDSGGRGGGSGQARASR